ncbi:glucose-6-phosphate isomerase [Lutimonas saemankumensis]|uniref:glucose-6-phosphate isomerase n=1 Tax=Lutimonas saemankumensis TaxID=483016 RepID=UPI001CD39A4B|nr:glucose-6-phosphate isomerase [Lutimonas saemankumensis]MCA0933006.1 glucose-6-phosphate isomerase [Lutimonas saemankumensis]
MSLININPTKTASWKELIKHHEEIKDVHMKSLFLEDGARKDIMSLQFEGLSLDFSKNRITEKTLELLVGLANESKLEDAIEKYFSGDKINETENRAVLHTALRNIDNNPVLVDGNDVMPEVNETLNKIEAFTEQVVNGSFKGFTGKAITDVVNIGIGGSDLGPNMVVEGLHFYKNHLNTHFVSNIDGDHVAEVIKDLNPETTLFVIVSKTFTTQETLTNAETIKKWFLKSATEDDIQYNFVAVSTNLEKVKNFGIDENNIFTMWNWVGGRYSLWSAVGLSISLAIGFQNFRKFLDGAYAMDQHFKNTDFRKNIPVIMALISIWYNNFFGSESEVVIPYTQYLQKLAPFLQQLSMESNGKSVDRNGEKVTYQTGNIIWGNTGTNVQHAFMQLVHQGTKLIPVDFIGFKESLHGNEDHHSKLMANFYAQAEALYAGKSAKEVHLDMKISGDEKKINNLLPFKVFEGNRPSNSFLIEKLDPRSLGSLISSYEHKTFVQGIIWNIYSFDQFGVELGKELANKLLIK